MDFYFKAFENRKPPEPIPYSAVREMLWQFLAVMMLVVGAWYLHWRWTASLNLEALWFAYPLVIAETGAYIGLLLFSYNLWFTRDFKQQSAPSNIRDCVSNPAVMPSRPLRVDVFFQRMMKKLSWFD